MKYPNLVSKYFCKTPCRVILYGMGITEDGEPEIIFDRELFCNWQGKGKTVITAEQKLIKLNGCALFCGDPFFDVSEITNGKIIISGIERQIWQGEKVRNPDGTINFTRLDVI